VEDITFYGCSDLEFSDASMRGCVVEESEEECPFAKPFTKSTILFDDCHIRTEDQGFQVSRLVEASDPHCHCQPEWDHKGEVYKGCSFTPDSEFPWCFLVEDETLCPEASGVGVGLQRWRYCEESKTSIVVPIVIPVDILKGDAAHGSCTSLVVLSVMLMLQQLRSLVSC